jgi:spore coat polysaccharide biosynthesis protein SpsF
VREEKLRIGVLIQARLSSSRIPEKMFYPFIDGILIQHCMRAARNIKANIYSLVVPEQDKDIFEPVARMEGFDVTSGPEHDVLKRFINAIRKYNLNIVVRITGDKLFLSAKYTNLLIEHYKGCDCDFACYDEGPLKEVTGGPYNALSLDAIDYDLETPQEWREHIRPAFINSPIYKTCILPVPEHLKILANQKFTIDTPEDYKKLFDLHKSDYYKEPIEIDDMEKSLWYGHECIKSRRTKQV